MNRSTNDPSVVIYEIETEQRREINVGDFVFWMNAKQPELIGQIIDANKESVYVKGYDGITKKLKTKKLYYFKNKIQYLKF